MKPIASLLVELYPEEKTHRHTIDAISVAHNALYKHLRMDLERRRAEGQKWVRIELTSGVAGEGDRQGGIEVVGLEAVKRKRPAGGLNEAQ